MNKLLTTTAVALLLGIGSAMAADDYEAPDQSGAAPEASQQDDSSLLPSDPSMKSEDPESGQPQAAMEDEGGQPPTTSTVSPDAAKEAKVPDQGSPDTSGGAKERSSAPPESGAVQDDESGDQSLSLDESQSDSDTSQE